MRPPVKSLLAPILLAALLSAPAPAGAVEVPSLEQFLQLQQRVGTLEGRTGDLARRQDASEERLDALEAGDTKPPDPPDPPIGPDPDNPYADMPANSWRAAGPPISSIWAEVQPSLDELTRGVNGFSSTINQWSGKGFSGCKFRIIGGGHRSTGYNRVTAYDICDLKPFWDSPDIRLDHPASSGACPFPEQQGAHAGPPAIHAYDSIVTLSNGDSYIWPHVPYDCKGPGNRAPWRVWKLSAAGEWSIAREFVGSQASGAYGSAVLPDDKIILLGHHKSAIFDPAAGDYVDYEVRSFQDKTGNYGNLVEAGTTGDGKLRFLWFNYWRSDLTTDIREITAHQNDAGQWVLGGGGVIANNRGAFDYVAGAVYLPDQDAMMFWHGKNRVVFLLFDEPDPVERLRSADYDQIRALPAGTKMQLMESGLQWIEDWGVVVAFGPHHSDGLHIFKPPANIRAASDPVLPPPSDLQALVDAAQPGAVLVLSDELYGPAEVRVADLTLACEDGTRIRGQVKSMGAVVAEADNLTVAGCDIKAGTNGENLAAIRIGGSGGRLTVKRSVLHDSDNGILACATCDGDILVEDSTFYNLGLIGRAHAIYRAIDKTAGNQPSGALIIRRSLFRDGKGEGHYVKSGAAATAIEETSFAGGSAPYSRFIDAFAGGYLALRDVTFAWTPGGNEDLVGYGGEAGKFHWPQPEIVMDRVSVSCAGAKVFLRIWPEVAVLPQFADSKVAGCQAVEQK